MERMKVRSKSDIDWLACIEIGLDIIRRSLPGCYIMLTDI